MKQIFTLKEWEKVLEESKLAPLVVYKHSITCGSCRPSFREMQEAVSYGEIVQPIYYVIVQESRELSDRIADDLGLEHQTPQAIVVLNKRACYAVDEDISAADIAAKIEMISEAHKELFSEE